MTPATNHRDDAFLRGGLGIARRVLDAVPALFQLDLSGRAALITATPSASLASRSYRFPAAETY